MSKMIGMSRNINLEWLNKVAELYISGGTESDIRVSLNEYLEFEIKSPTNLRKTRTILTNIWVKDTEDMEEFKEIAVDLFKTDKIENILLAHWCLTILAYPVFSDICSTIGNMDSNMSPINNREIKNKMFDLWGERSTLFHSIDKNIRTLKDMGVLSTLEGNQYGVIKFTIKDSKAMVFIVKTIVHMRDKLYVSIDELNNSSEFFPFEYNIGMDILEESGLFLIDKFGGELVVSSRD